MSFNPDPIKQAIEACFSHKSEKEVYPPLKLNDSKVQSANRQKHYFKLDFNEHVNNKINKCNTVKSHEYALGVYTDKVQI